MLAIVSALFIFSNESAFADENSLPATYWTASSSIGGSGSTNSPYIIATPQDVAYLADAVNAGTSFANAHFSLNNDLDMSGYLTMPIGSSTSRAFDGIFDGNGYTIYGLTISRNAENTALFSFIGSNAIVRNFIIAEDSLIIGTRYTASAIGRCAAGTVVEEIISYADVRGTSTVGGIVGNNYQGTVSNCIFAGSLTSSVGAHGIEGTDTHGKGTGSWYLTSNFSYTHNGRGNLLYMGSNGSVSAAIVEGVPTFTLSPAMGFDNEIRTADEHIVSEDSVFVPDTDLNDVMYFARFVKTVEIGAIQNGTIEGAGTYYEGQDVKIKIKPNTGYYFNSLTSNITPTGASYSNDIDNSVVYSFTMPNSNLTFNGNLGAFEPDSGAITTEFTYDGEQKIVTDEATLQNSGYPDFDFVVSCVCPIQGTLPTPPVKAGSYTTIVTISKSIDSQSIIIGRAEYPVTINKAKLQIIDSSAFSASKQYDNKATITLPVAQDNFTALSEDRVNMTASATYYTDIDMQTVAYARGEGYFVKYAFIIDGADSANYLAPDSIIISNASITTRQALVSVEERFLSKVYNELPPSIQAYSADSVGVIDIKFIFTPISAGAGDSDVGCYSVTVDFRTDIINPNNDNHTLLLAGEYIFEILPMKVEVAFSGYNNLAYTGAEQYIVAMHDTVYANTPAAAGITYKMNDEEVPLLNAGDYIAYAYSLNPNYELTGTTTCEFSVSKIEQTTPLNIEQVADLTYKAAPITLSTTGGDGDGAVSYEIVSGLAEIEGNELVLKGGGEVQVQATKAEGQNYFVASSAIMSFLVDKAELTVSVTNTENHITYNDILELAVTYSGFVEGEEHLTEPTGLQKPTIWLAGNSYNYNAPVRLSASEIGYAIILSGGSSDAYTIIADNSSEPLLFVDKKALTIRAASIEKIYGQNDPTLSYTIDEGTFTLNGVLARVAGNNIGDYDIGQNTLTNANNPNFDITFVANIFTIKRATLTIRLSNKSKQYGEGDPRVDYEIIGLVYEDTCQVFITREEGESPGFYLYLLDDITVSSNYNVKFNEQERGLTINTILPVISAKPNASTIIYGSQLAESTFSGGIVKAVTNEGEMTIYGIYLWEIEENIYPDMEDSNATLYPVRFIPNDEINYRQLVFECTVTVAPLEFGVLYDGAQELIYTGKPQKYVSALPIGVLEGDDINFSFSYNGDMVDVGVYSVIPAFDNPNYTLAADSEYEVRIVKKTLRITLKNAEYNDNNVPKPEFSYNGFVEGENASVLAKLPTADMPSKAGSHLIAPYGASSDNYKFTYNKGTVIVKQSVLYTQEEAITAVGSYDASVSLQASIIPKNGDDKFDAFDTAFKQYKQGKHNLNGLSLKSGYSFSYMQNGKEIEPGELITIRVKVPANLAHARDFAVLYYSEDGEIQVVEGATMDGNYLVLVTDQMGDYVLATNNDYTIFVIIIVIAAILALLLFVDIGVRIRTKHKASGFEYQKRYNHAYRQAKREKKKETKLTKAKTREERDRARQFKYVSRDDLY